MLDYMLLELDGADSNQQWLTTLHRAGNTIMMEYLKEEENLHPGGELEERYQHFYNEYPVFKVTYTESPQSIEFTRSMVIRDRAVIESMPGAWQCVATRRRDRVLSTTTSTPGHETNASEETRNRNYAAIHTALPRRMERGLMRH